MMKTALSIVQAFCYKSGVITAPTSIVSSTDPQVLKLVYCLYAACEKIREGKCWEVQKRKYSFSTEASRANYPLPEDFYSPLLQTHYNQSSDLLLQGPVSDGQMAYYLYGGGSSPNSYAYRIFGPDVDRTTAGQFEVSPTPGGVETLSFEYVTRNLFIPEDWDSTSRTVYETVSDNTDLCLFDYDLVQLGMEVEYTAPSDPDYEQLKANFENRINKAVARSRGPFIGSFEGATRYPRYSIPDREWSFS